MAERLITLMVPDSLLNVVVISREEDGNVTAQLKSVHDEDAIPATREHLARLLFMLAEAILATEPDV